MSYNGWTNYETWNVMLWVDGDEAIYNVLLEYARQLARTGERADYDELFTRYLGFGEEDETPDGVKWFGEEVNREEVEEAINEMAEDM